jgi:subtilisin-like proprotein convertase family protein
MRIIQLFINCTVAVLFFCTSLHSQIVKKIDLNAVEVSPAVISSLGEPQIKASEYKLYSIDIASLISQLSGISHVEYDNNGFVGQIAFPHPDGTQHSYLAKENYTMDPVLGAQFPEIKSYDAQGSNDGSFVKWDITPHGLHAMIMIQGQSTIFIDPVIKGNTEYYIVYSRDNFITDKVMDCLVEGNIGIDDSNNSIVKSFGTCEKRTYRLALAATGEYTAFHGGTVALALAAQVTTMNRINGVYEREMAIHMNIIANNNLIIYTNGATDPYTNNNGGTMLNENQTNITTVIGSANYDIGHVFSTGGGGIAQLNSPCTSSGKARGVTGSGAPIGDPFDIDYVAHEMGHQFGGNHTFNSSNSGSCSGNANAATSFEPGSGTTIMAYAGICAPVNVQNNSDDYFHTKSLQEIGVFITSAGHTCPVKTPLANVAPVVAPLAPISVPQGTPFFLTASATDANASNVLTYCWEEMDAGTSTTAPVATQTTKANFRSFDPTTNSTRYFPSLASLASNGLFTWEVLPTVARTMNFRVTVRDNATGGGCNDEENMTVAIIATTTPFSVTYPTNTGITWAGASSQTVTWAVAGTTASPISCANVDILLSTDGGLTYPTILASNVTNDGTQIITVPNTPSTTCRIMVRCAGGNFFDISNNNFTISASTFDYTLTATPSSIAVCQPNNAVFTINIGSIGGYNSLVNLSVTGVPAGATTSFSSASVTPVGTSTLTISNTALAATGTYTITITGNSTSGTKVTTVQLSIASGAPTAVTLISPANAATGVAIPTIFTWSTAAGSGITYDFQVATSSAFTTIVDQSVGLATASYSSSLLATSTIYYWRVRVVSGCGTSAWSSINSFTTGTCATTASSAVPVAISATGTPTISSTITIPYGGTITDVNVLNLAGTHSYISDLTVTLTSPAGTSVALFTGICTNNANFNLNFDGASASAYASIVCPPTSGGTYQPQGNFSSFNGQNPAGVWTLTITDGADQDGGSLSSWALNICATPPCTVPSTPIVTVSNNCGNSVLTTSGTSLLWSTGATTPSITVSAAGSYTVTQTVGGCASLPGSGTASPIAIPSTPIVTVTNNCGNSVLTTSGTSLLWSAGATTPSITVSAAGTSTVTQTVGGCASLPGSGTAAPIAIPSTPIVTVINNCGNSVLTTSGTSLLWSTGATTSSITVSSAGTYTVTRTVGGCASLPGSGTAAPIAIPSTPIVTVANNCGNSVLTTSGTSLLWSTGATTPSITVSTAGTSTVTQTVGGCTSLPGSGTAAPIAIPATPIVTVINSCGNSVLTTSGTSLLWSTGATTSSITVSSAGTYTVTRTVGGCTSLPGSGTVAPIAIPATPIVTVSNNCGNSVLTTSGTSLLWSTGATTPSITVSTAGTSTVTQTVGGCTSLPGSGPAAPIAIPSTPIVTVSNNCGNSVMTTSGTSLLWSTGATTPSITVSTAGTSTVTQTVGGCTSLAGSGTTAPLVIPSISIGTIINPTVCGLANGTITINGTGSGNLTWTGTSLGGVTNVTLPYSTAGLFAGTYSFVFNNGCPSSAVAASLVDPSAPSAPIVNITDNCGSSILSATGTNLLWSTGSTTPVITVTTAGSYTVTQTAGGCVSAAATIIANPLSIPSAPNITTIDSCGSSILTADGTDLLWSTGANTSSITVSAAGNYTVSQTVNGCTSPVGTAVANPLIVPSVVFSPLADVCINTPEFPLTSALPVGGVYSGIGVAGNQFNPNVAGYGVFTIQYTFTDANGCSDVNQQPITVGCASIDSKGELSIEVYPNPSNGLITIKTSGESVEQVIIFDGAGKLVEVIENQLNKSQINIDLSAYAQGIYTFEMKTSSLTTRERIIIGR